MSLFSLINSLNWMNFLHKILIHITRIFLLEIFLFTQRFSTFFPVKFFSFFRKWPWNDISCYINWQFQASWAPTLEPRLPCALSRACFYVLKKFWLCVLITMWATKIIEKRLGENLGWLEEMTSIPVAESQTYTSLCTFFTVVTPPKLSPPQTASAPHPFKLY